MINREPERLRLVGATDLEKRLLAAAASETPPPESIRRVARSLGIAAVAAAGTAAPVRASAAAASSGMGWPIVSAGVLALAVSGVAVGWSRLHPSPSPEATASASVDRATGATVAVGAAQTGEAADRPAAEAAPPVAAVPRPARAIHRAAREGDLRAQIALVDAARAAVSSGADGRALALLHRYDATYPAGTFRPESAALQVEAFARLGQADRARRLGRAFIAAHPNSPLIARVQRAIAASSP